ncbi:hypothetical protein [Leptospira gomenensis]|uniref:hypothetical protein n=1 Tax=Leptospira gomenensis TaxID=2484974 RepID=UPI0014385A78|nr:hypothetical protein [Leptospira gomenensis]
MEIVVLDLILQMKSLSSTPASDQGVVKLLALEKCNVLKAEYNNLTGAASAVRRTRHW